MRTILLIGLLSIADAINPNWMPDKNTGIYIALLIIAILGDVVTTITKLTKK
jgi:hypothetical protein